MNRSAKIGMKLFIKNRPAMMILMESVAMVLLPFVIHFLELLFLVGVFFIFLCLSHNSLLLTRTHRLREKNSLSLSWSFSFACRLPLSLYLSLSYLRFISSDFYFIHLRREDIERYLSDENLFSFCLTFLFSSFIPDAFGALLFGCRRRRHNLPWHCMRVVH